MAGAAADGGCIDALALELLGDHAGEGIVTQPRHQRHMRAEPGAGGRRIAGKPAARELHAMGAELQGHGRDGIEAVDEVERGDPRTDDADRRGGHDEGRVPT